MAVSPWEIDRQREGGRPQPPSRPRSSFYNPPRRDPRAFFEARNTPVGGYSLYDEYERAGFFNDPAMLLAEMLFNRSTGGGGGGGRRGGGGGGVAGPSVEEQEKVLRRLLELVGSGHQAQIDAYQKAVEGLKPIDVMQIVAESRRLPQRTVADVFGGG